MTKNIEDLLYRGDSLERMGDISSRLREDSRKYKKAAVRINWELLLKQVICPLEYILTKFGQRY
jgi:vesicle transport protein SEC22